MKRAVLCAAIVGTTSLATSSSVADSPPSAVLAVRVTNLRSNDGQVGCLLYGSAKGFPKDPSAALERLWSPIDQKSAVCRFASMPAGIYAVASFHDENKNGKLDTGAFGIPTEGTVVSNHAKGFMGPPSFEKAKFSLAGSATEIELRMGY